MFIVYARECNDLLIQMETNNKSMRNVCDKETRNNQSASNAISTVDFDELVDRNRGLQRQTNA